LKLLLDTHVFIWWMTAEPRLTSQVRQGICDPGNELFLSSISVVEMAIKIRLGKLRLDGPLEQFVVRGMVQGQVSELPLTIRHALELASLPLHHRDPFDRLLLAQAIAERMSLVTQDSQLRPYGVNLIG
jgi:PIN domain nuclease of toxin-antitoxin system